MNTMALLTILVGGISTLAIYSFLVKENSFYRLFEHIFIGVSAGLGAVLAIKNFLWPKVLVPMLGLDIIQYPDGTLSKPYQPWLLVYLIPMAFGMLYYFIYSRKHSWLAKLVIGFSLGMSGGIAFKGFFNEIIPQLVTSFKPLVVLSEGAVQWGASLSNIIFVLTLLTVMYYFFFSFKLGAGVGPKISIAARWLMMICFGAFFGSTVMARLALLVERLQFLLTDWSSALAQLFGHS